MNNVGVLKTWNWSAIFNNRLSWYIYTPTEKFENHQENQHFLTLYTNFIQYRTKYRKTPRKSTLSPTSHPQSKTPIQTTFFLYKYKNPKKIPLSPITNFSLKIISIHQKFTLISNTKREINNVTKISNQNKIKEQKPNDTTNN